MISIRELITGIYGAWRLLHFDRTAIQYFDSTTDAFWKSFYAALVILPPVIVLRVMFFDTAPDEFAAAGIGRVASVFAIDYVYQWVLFPLIMIYLAEMMGRNRQYIRFIVARNWSQVIQIAMFLPAAAIFMMRETDEPGWRAAILLAAYVATWVYEWFVTRAALDISSTAAAIIVAIGVAVSFGISGFSEALILIASQ